MNALARCFRLPLLVKELLEQAARPRTYWTRVAYGALLYLVVLVPQRYFFTNAGDPRALLGEGRSLFEELLTFQFFGIAFFLPALMCGRITQEKERDSLVLLLLTDLSPAQIVLQKYLAGIVPMLTFLLLGLPLAAVAYAFGGFPAQELANAAIALLLACLQLGAIAIWCSAFCRNTVAAFLATYAVALLFYLGPTGVMLLIQWYDPRLPVQFELFYLHFPIAILKEAQFRPGNVSLSIGIIAGTTLLFLGLATYHLRRRAFAPPANLGRKLFGWLDGLMQRVNRFFGNVIVGRPASGLPGDQPILWRERRSRLLSRPVYLVRLLMVVEVPVFLLALSISISPRGGGLWFDRDAVALSIFGAAFGTLGVLALSVTAANAFVTERVNQTFEVLLTTPLTAREIVRQKARALRGMVLVCAIPLLTIFGFEALVEYTGVIFGVSQERDSAAVYVACTILSLVIYLPLIVWLSLWIGLATRTRLRAIVTTICIVVGWCGLPYFIFGAIMNIDVPGSGAWLYFASPLAVPAANEMGVLREFAPDSPWLPILVNFTLYGIVLYAIRAHCLENADRYLRR